MRRSSFTPGSRSRGRWRRSRSSRCESCGSNARAVSPDGNVVRNCQSAALLALSFHSFALGCLALPILARATDAAPRDCAARAAAFRERLEAVTEAAIDGRPERVPAAAERAQAWWRLHGASLGDHARADSLLANLVSAARAHGANASARLAVRLSTESLRWCTGALSTPDQLMVLDLAGMAAWLRARGLASEEPAGSGAVAESVAAALLHAQHSGLAARLRVDYAAAQSQTGGQAADVRAAVRLLDLVDEIEKVLH